MAVLTLGIYEHKLLQLPTIVGRSSNIAHFNIRKIVSYVESTFSHVLYTNGTERK